ncbi:MAG TPA: phenylalanine--tRNA ligase subunit beta [Candidatus Omnitrophota bacterium]|nr:phenylalanine--tRNA ligase subunit beta [Candidatus Omnitrophota bacterium]
MKVSLNWLKDYVTPGIGAEELAHRLTMAGLEVETIHSADGDKVFEIEVTPNRADCLSMVGISREVAAILNKTRKPPRIKDTSYPKIKCEIAIEDKSGCSRYIGTVIEGVTVGQAPDWMRKNLSVVGIRPISNIVDITNFCLMESGQPLHAFDYDKLIGGKIAVRRARKGEKIVTIDGLERELDETILVIADSKRPVAIAGIMGGKDAEVNEKTKNILLESAYFDPILIRRAARKLGLASDSSYRFERGVDRGGVKTGSDRAASLILEIAKGKVTRYADVNITGKTKTTNSISVSVQKVNQYLGADILSGRCQTILKKLDFKVAARGKGGLLVQPPSTRPDVKLDVDVIEEIARIEGYDRLPTSFPTIKISDIPLDEKRFLREKIRKALIAQGFDEVITYSMTNREVLVKAKQNDIKSVKVINPLTQEQEVMRPSLLPGLLNTVSFNINRAQKDLKIFEASKIYRDEGEIEALGIMMTGMASEDWRQAKKQHVDFYDIKGAIVKAIRYVLGCRPMVFVPLQENFLEPGLSAAVELDGSVIGLIGKVEEGVLNSFDIKNADVWFAQIELKNIISRKPLKRAYQTISPYPAIVRDVSLTIDKRYFYQQLVEIIKEKGLKNLVEIHFKEDYTNMVRDKIASHHRGILLSLVYQSAERTLQEAEVNNDHQKLLKALVERLQVVIR